VRFCEALDNKQASGFNQRNIRTRRGYPPDLSYQEEKLCIVWAFLCDRQYIFLIQSGKDTYRLIHNTYRTAYNPLSFSLTDS
jgi:hypothetical protein